MAEQLNNVVLWDSTNAKMRTIDTSDDTLRWNVNTTIGGNLTVTGTTTTVHSETVLIQDNFLDLNYGNTTSGSGEAGGLTVNYQATGTSTTASAFAASPPTITVADSSGFADGDIIQVYGSSDQAANDGIFIVASVSAGTIVCEGDSGTTVSEPFARDNFTAATGQSANIRKVNLSVLRANASGVWQIGTGATAPLTYENVQKGSDSADSLQGAYNAGATITTASSTDIAFTLTSGDFTATGAGSVNLTPTGASSFTSGGALTLTAGGASTWSTSSGALTIDSAGVLTMDTDGTDAINLGTESAAKTITIGADASTMVDINALDIQLDAGSGGYDIDGAGNSTITTSGSGTLTIDSAGALVIDTDGTDSISIGTEAAAKTITVGNDASTKVDLNALAIELDSAGTIVANSAGAMTLDAAAASNFTVAGANLDLKTTTSGDVNVSAAANLDLDGATVNCDSTGVMEFQGGGNSFFRTSSGTMQLQGQGDTTLLSNGGDAYVTSSSGTVSISGGAAATVTDGTATQTMASGALSYSGVTTASIPASSTFDIDAGGAMTLDAASFTVGGDGDTGAIAMTATSAAMTLTAAGINLAGGSGEVDITTSGALDMNVGSVDLDSTAGVAIDATTMSLDGTDDSNFTVTGSGKDLVLAAAGGGAQKLQLDSAGTGTDAIDISASAGGVDIDAAGALAMNGSTVTVTATTELELNGTVLDGNFTDDSSIIVVGSGKDLSLSVAGGGTQKLTLSSAGTGAQAIKLESSSGGIDMDSNGIFSANATGANLNLKTSTSGNITLEAADIVENKSFIGLNGKDATDTVAHNAKVGYVMAVSQNVTEGQALYYGLAGSGGSLRVADASSIDTARFIGFAAGAISNGNWGNVTTVQGSLAKVIFDSTPSGDSSTGDLGKAVYLSEDAGKVTLTPPTTAGSVVFQVGYLAYASGFTTGNLIHVHPQLIIENPA